MLSRLSLTTRLAAFFTTLAALGILGLGGLFMVLADRHFIELDQHALADKQQLIEHLVMDAHSRGGAQRSLQRALAHQNGVRVLIRDASGETVFLSPTGANALAETGTHSAMHSDRHFTLSPAQMSHTPWQVSLQMDTDFHTRFLHELRRNLIGYASIATLIAGILGWLAAHQGLAPLRAMKKRAAGVSAQQLEPRMPEESVPVEMADLAQELNRMLRRLQDDFRRLSEFSSDLAHELRTPISNLLTQTQVTLSAPRAADEYREVLISNAEELERLSRMVSDMLFLAKTEHGVDLPNKTRFSAADEIRGLMEFHGIVAEERGITLSLQGEGEIHGDCLMFRRAISNVLANALRHADDGSRVEIALTNADGYVSVSIGNTGDDISAEKLPRVFDRFYSADPARSHPGAEGSGLGLAITRAIVEAHGGQAKVVSGNRNTCFTLQFPAFPHDIFTS